MSRLILPGQVRGGLTILVPRGYESAEPPPKVGECVLCDVEFYTEDDARRHFESARNARIHKSLADEARQARLEERMPIFSEDAWDPEWAEHQRKVGERMRRERRLVPHKHER